MGRYVRLWVVVLALLTGLTLVVRTTGDEPAAAPAQEPTRSPRESPRAQATASTTATTASAEPSDLAPGLPSTVDPSAAGTSIRCWSGDEAVDLAGCPPLRGEAALRHVFPRLDAEGLCVPVPVDADDGLKTAALRCPVEVGGTTATVTYSEFVDRRALTDYYRAKYDGPTGRSGDLVLFGPAPVGERGRVQGTAVYAEGGRWSVSFRGDDEELTRRVLDTVEVRRWQVLLETVAPADLDLNDP